MNELHIASLFDLSKTVASALFGDLIYPWEALPRIKDWILEAGPKLPASEYTEIAPHVWAHRSAEIAPNASIAGPCIICENAEIRHCAFIRGSAVIGAGTVVGNSTELKNAVLFDKVQVPHYNYVGDSILGYRAHMGAGAITSNVKSDKSLVNVHGIADIPTGLKKFGAILGDDVEIGCNSVLNPGTVIGRGSNIYPLSMVRGVIPAASIFKQPGCIVPKSPG